MTAWQVSGVAFGLVAYAVAWAWGGRPERFGAGVLIVFCLISSLTYGWQVGGLHLATLLADICRLWIFGWLCLRSDRWWPFVVTACVGLMVLVQSARLVDPSISQFAVGSADVGLGYLLDLALLLGAWERRLAGEPPGAPLAWAKAARLMAARRDRKARPSEGAGGGAATGVAWKEIGRSARCEPAEASDR